MAMIGKVLRLHHREKKSVREIVKATSLARNTVRKYLRIDKAEAPKYRRPEVPTKLAPFVEAVQQALIARVRQFPGQEKQVWEFYRKNPDQLATIRAPMRFTAGSRPRISSSAASSFSSLRISAVCCTNWLRVFSRKVSCWASICFRLFSMTIRSRLLV